MSAEGLWKYIEAEALDGASVRTGRVSKAIVIVEIEGTEADADKVRRLRITRHASGRRLRPSEESGLLGLAFAESLNGQ